MLHYIICPDVEMPNFVGWSITHIVKPWHEWLFIIMYKPTCLNDFMLTWEQVHN